MTRRAGFTLVELMVVVAIIGILASIAIPNFMDMQYRAKRAELPGNIDGIKTAELAYSAAFDTLVEQPDFIPSESVGKQAEEWTGAPGFDTLGWAPDGLIRGAYKVDTSDEDFTVYGISDVDGDGDKASYTATRTTNVAPVTPSRIY